MSNESPNVGVLCDHLPDEFDTGEFSSNIFIEIPYDFRTLQENGRGKLVGVERFELPTSCSQSRRATGLRYTPKILNNVTKISLCKV